MQALAEESGKLRVLRQLATARGDKELRDVWRDYRSHRVKNAAWIMMNLVATKGARTLQDMRPMFDKDSDHPVVLDTLKQMAFYTDSYRKGHWSEPHLVIDNDVCWAMIVTAKALAGSAEVTTREIELWIEHIGAKGSTEAAVRDYFRAMKAEGLSSHNDDEVDRFLGLAKTH